MTNKNNFFKNLAKKDTELISQFISNMESRGVLENYSVTKKNQTVPPEIDFKEVDKLIDNEPVARGALNWKIDKAMEGGYLFLDGNDKLDKSLMKRMNRDYLWEDRFLIPAFYMLAKYGTAFGEVRRSEIPNEDGTREVIGINTLDTVNIEPVTRANGDLIKFVSRLTDPLEGERPEWDTQEMFWMRHTNVFRGWSPIDIASLKRTIMAKYYVKTFVAWLFATGQYRNVHNVEGALKKEELLSMFDRSSNLEEPFVVKGEYKQEALRDLSELNGFPEFMAMFDREILIAMRVPPITAGIPEASGRSNSDTMTEEAMTHIKRLKHAVSYAVNHELLPKMNIGTKQMVWKPDDRKKEQKVLENLNIMHNMGMTKEVKEEFLRNNGIVFDSTIFEDEPELEEQNSNEEIPGGADIDLMPSRFNPGEEQESIGTGEDASTREEQLE